MPHSIAITLAILITVNAVSAQTEYSEWVFGSNAAITFNDGRGGVLSTPLIVSGRIIDVREGSMAYSHPCDGRLSVYAMGETAYDGSGSVMQNGTLLSGGASSSQGGLWVRDLARPFSVYLFLTPDMTDISATGKQQYSLNRAEQNASGQWVMVERDIVLDPRPGSERITATHDVSGNGYWVMLQFTDTLNARVEFNAYHVTATGVSASPRVSAFTVLNLPHQAGSMKFSPDGTRMVMTDINGSNIVAMYDFNTTTGDLTNPQFVNVLAPFPHTALTLNYSSSFTTSGQYIYTSFRSGTSAIIVRLAVSAFTGATTLTAELVKVLPLVNTYPASLQLGPNRNIYFPNNDYLGEITTPDAAVLNSLMVRDQAYQFSGTPKCRLGLPSCMESTFLRPTPVLTCGPPAGEITTQRTCVGVCATIETFMRSQPSRWQWSFPGGRPQVWFDSLPPVVCYDTAGSYEIILVASNIAGSTTIKDTITVFAPPIVYAGQDASVCVGGYIQLNAIGAATYRWTSARSSFNNANIANAIGGPVNTRTVFRVEGTSHSGCVGIDSVVVVPGQLVGVVSNDTTICEGQSVTLNAYGGNQCNWLDNASKRYSRTVSPTVTTTYYVVFRDAICFDTASVTVTVAPPITLTLLADTSVCANKPFRLNVSTDATRVSWEPASLLDDATSTSPTAIITQPTQFIVTAFSSQGCVVRDTVDVGITNGTVVARPDTAVCAGQTVELRAVASGPLEWRDLSSNTIIPGSSPVITVVVPTRYEVITLVPCRASDTVFVDIDKGLIASNYDATVCRGGTVVMIIDEGGLITWEPSAGAVTTLNDSTYQFAPVGTTTFIGLLQKTGSCPLLVSCVITVIEPSTSVVRVLPSAGNVGSVVAVPIEINTTSAGGTIVITMRGTAGLLWEPPWDGPVEIQVTSALQRTNARATILLINTRERTIDVDVASADTCSSIISEGAVILTDVCALSMRQVLISQPVVLMIDKRGITAEGSGQIELRIFNTLAQLVTQQSGSKSTSISISSLPAGLFFAIAVSGAQVKILSVVIE